MMCPFKRCEDQVTHCDGACHGVMPDGSPMLELPELRAGVVVDEELLTRISQNNTTAGAKQ